MIYTGTPAPRHSVFNASKSKTKSNLKACRCWCQSSRRGSQAAVYRGACAITRRRRYLLSEFMRSRAKCLLSACKPGRLRTKLDGWKSASVLSVLRELTGVCSLPSPRRRLVRELRCCCRGQTGAAEPLCCSGVCGRQILTLVSIVLLATYISASSMYTSVVHSEGLSLRVSGGRPARCCSATSVRSAQ